MFVSIFCNFSIFYSILKKVRGGGQVVSVLAFFSDNPSSNSADVNNFTG